MDRYCIWRIISRTWTEIGIEEKECRELLEEAGVQREGLAKVDRIIFRDVCLSFAVDAFLIFPMMSWPARPDGGYDEPYLRRRMGRWYARPYWAHLLNPIRWFGYPLAALMALQYRAMIRRVVLDK